MERTCRSAQRSGRELIDRKDSKRFSTFQEYIDVAIHSLIRSAGICAFEMVVAEKAIFPPTSADQTSNREHRSAGDQNAPVGHGA
jgi:hypothetical protein